MALYSSRSSANGYPHFDARAYARRFYARSARIRVDGSSTRRICVVVITISAHVRANQFTSITMLKVTVDVDICVVVVPPLVVKQFGGGRVDTYAMNMCVSIRKTARFE